MSTLINDTLYLQLSESTQRYASHISMLKTQHERICKMHIDIRGGISTIRLHNETKLKTKLRERNDRLQELHASAATISNTLSRQEQDIDAAKLKLHELSNQSMICEKKVLDRESHFSELIAARGALELEAVELQNLKRELMEREIQKEISLQAKDDQNTELELIKR